MCTILHILITCNTKLISWPGITLFVKKKKKERGRKESKFSLSKRLHFHTCDLQKILLQVEREGLPRGGGGGRIYNRYYTQFTTNEPARFNSTNARALCIYFYLIEEREQQICPAANSAGKIQTNPAGYPKARGRGGGMERLSRRSRRIQYVREIKLRFHSRGTSTFLP